MERIKGKIFYHIHDNFIYKSKLWVEGNEFEITNEYDSLFGMDLKNMDIEEAKKNGDSVIKRELALEEIRQQYYPEKISRFHCVWLCDEEGLEYWKKLLFGKIYRLSVTGVIFESSANFLYTKDEDYKTIKENNRIYWNPKFQTEEDIEKKEFLFQGKIKVLEKVEK